MAMSHRTSQAVPRLGEMSVIVLVLVEVSGQRDSNPRPSAPKADALPDCAMPRPARDHSTVLAVDSAVRKTGRATMSARLIDGKAIAARVREDVRKEVAALKAAGKRVPGLGVILVGADPASAIYVRHKREACLAAGMHSVV